MFSLGSDPATYAAETESIIARTKALYPSALSGLSTTQEPEKKMAGTEISAELLAAITGARPSREGGARIAREDLLLSSPAKSSHGGGLAARGVTLVHNYGAGGTGFQAGRGMAVDAVALVERDVLKGIMEPLVAKL